MLQMFLWGKPGWELQEGSKVDPELLKEAGEGIKNRCNEVAKTSEKLLADGWQGEISLYDVCFYHNDVKNKKELEERLENLGLDIELFDIIDEDEDEDCCEDEDCDCEEACSCEEEQK